jgi:putative phosphoesterase
MSVHMRIAVLADIHGNVVALEAVLDDLSHRQADLVVDLGDCVSGPLWPRETMERLAALGFPTVRGNCDRAVGMLARDELGVSDRFAFDQLDAEQRFRLGALPTSLVVAPGVLAVHAAPNHDDVYLLDIIEGGRLVRDGHRSIAARLGPVDAKVVLCGHSHRPDFVQLPSGPAIVNPGSVGMPAYYHAGHVSESGCASACYGILELHVDGNVSVELIALPYAHEQAARRAQENGRSEWADSWRTGFMPHRD